MWVRKGSWWGKSDEVFVGLVKWEIAQQYFPVINPREAIRRLLFYHLKIMNKEMAKLIRAYFKENWITLEQRLKNYPLNDVSDYQKYQKSLLEKRSRAENYQRARILFKT